MPARPTASSATNATTRSAPVATTSRSTCSARASTWTAQPRRRRCRPRPAGHAAGVPQPQRRPPVGAAVQRHPTADAARLHRPGRLSLPGVRPGSDLRRRAVLRVPAAVPNRALCHAPRNAAARREPAPDCWIGSWRTDAVDTGTRALDKTARSASRRPSPNSVTASSTTPTTMAGVAASAHRRTIRPRLPAGPAAPGLPAAVLLRRRGPQRPARPGSLTRGQGPLRHLLLHRPTAPALPHPRGGPHPTCGRPNASSSSALGRPGACPNSASPPSAVSSTPTPAPSGRQGQPGPDLLIGADLSNHALLQPSAHWPGPVNGRTPTRGLPPPGRRGTRQRLRVPARTHPSGRPRRHDLPPRGHGRQRPQDHRLLLHPTGPGSALLDTALDPLLDDAVKNADDPERCRTAPTRVDRVRPGLRLRRLPRRRRPPHRPPTGPGPLRRRRTHTEQVQHALRDVIGRCIYGVDLNDLAAELAKVSLWLEAWNPASRWASSTPAFASATA